MNDEHDETATILAELREISNRSSARRFKREWKGIEVKRMNTNSRPDQMKEQKNKRENVGDEPAEEFLAQNPEKSSLNQYWYSKPTIDVLCRSILEGLANVKGKKVAFLSTPSLYFSLPATDRRHCALLDYETAWEDDPGFQFYDYNEPKTLKSDLHGTFDMVVIDPPFIARDVWEKYAITANILLKHPPLVKNGTTRRGLVLGTTVAENESAMRDLFEAQANIFKPNIPNLVYQYNVFTNFHCNSLCLQNLEISD